MCLHYSRWAIKCLSWLGKFFGIWKFRISAQNVCNYCGYYLTHWTSVPSPVGGGVKDALAEEKGEAVHIFIDVLCASYPYVC